MCRYDLSCCSYHDAAQMVPMPIGWPSASLSMNATAAIVTPGKEAMQARSEIKRNVIPKNLDRFTEGALPKQPDVEKLSDRVICILGKNPSAFTLNGTNIYLIGTGKRRILLDAGESTPRVESVIETLEELFIKEGVEKLDEIIITHLHHDHVGGAKLIAKRFGPCRISKFPSPKHEIARRKEFIRMEKEKAGIAEDSDELPMAAKITWIGLDFELNSGYHKLSEGELIKTEGASLRVFWTPGHAGDHVVVMLEEERSLFSGDHVLGWGTSWVDDLGLYMQSLHKIRLLNPMRLYPGHGPVVENAIQHVTRYIDHRDAREKQVLDLIKEMAPFSESSAARGITSKQLTDALYPDVTKSMFDRAEGNILKILVKLRRDGTVVSFDPDVRQLSSLDDAATEFAEKQKGSDGRSDPKVAVEEYEKIWYARTSAIL